MYRYSFRETILNISTNKVKWKKMKTFLIITNTEIHQQNEKIPLESFIEWEFYTISHHKNHKTV